MYKPMRFFAPCLLAIGCTTAAPPPPEAPKPVAPPTEPSEPPGMPANYLEMKPDRVVAQMDALLLVDEASNSVMPVYIGGTEAASIDARLHGITPPRPLTHDLLDSVMKKLHATLVKVQIDELREVGDGTAFIGSIYVRANGRIFFVDARPSDAVALAIGNHVPIYVSKNVLARARMKWDDVKQQLNSADKPAS